MTRQRGRDALAALALLLLPLLLFAPQTLGGRTLIPAENLYQYEPWRSERAEAGAPTPHNALISDLVLQTYGWQRFARAQLAAGELPLWSPHLFAGQPFFAAGQASAFYPLRLPYHLLPLPAAFGWYTVLHLWLAGLGMYVYLRALRLGHFGALLGAVAQQLTSWLVVYTVFAPIQVGGVWLPWLLAMMEGVIFRRPGGHWLGGARRLTLPWVLGGALVFSLIFLAGHAEMMLYTSLIALLYGGGRLLGARRRGRRWLWRHAAALAAIAIGGIGLGAIQWLPNLVFLQDNFRALRPEFASKPGQYAHANRDILLFLAPDLFGNPSHHRLYDWQNGRWVDDFSDQQDHTFWGIKNYVEGAAYTGILPLALAALALFSPRRRYLPRALLAALAALGVSWMFGLPTYDLLFHLVPGFKQLHSPFRWIFLVSFAVAALAGVGADGLWRGGPIARRRAGRIALFLLAAAAVLALALLASLVAYETISPAIAALYERIDQAQRAFREARWFYHHLFGNGLRLALVAGAAGSVLWWGSRAMGSGRRGQRTLLWPALMIAFVAADLFLATHGFFPTADPALLDHQPAAVQWLQQQEGDWRLTALEAPDRPRLLHANAGALYGLEDLRGYNSIFRARYVRLMETISPQNELKYSRIAPISGRDDWQAALASPTLELLNLRFLLAHPEYDLRPLGWQLRQDYGEFRIWEMPAERQLPRAYTVAQAGYDLAALERPAHFQAALINERGAREMRITAYVNEPAFLILSQNYDRGWRAYARDGAGGEEELELRRALISLTAVELPAAGEYDLRLVYSPRSFLLGGFISFSSAALLVFAAGASLWRRVFHGPAVAAGGMRRLARNSLAPILLNLFNRSIDFLFTAFLLRVISPEDAGLYRVAIAVFIIFEIFTNFGLNTLLTREAARSPHRQRQLLAHTSALRLALFAIGTLPLTVLILLRLNGIPAPLDPRGAMALALLYGGLLPGTFSAGLTALYYARERAEYPAAVSSLATLNKALLGVFLLALGGGIVGLAALSIFTNLLTLLALLVGARQWLRAAATSVDRARGRWRIDLDLLRRLVSESWPLMLNHFLATIFFQIDLLIIELFHGTRMVAQYDIGYKWVLAVNVIPAFYTMALLPRLSRYARRNRELLRASYALSIKLLLALALPLALWMTLAARPLTAIIGGGQYLPEGAIAIQLLVWSMPIGWVNSLTQYALIAIEAQRRVTIAFIIATTFNIAVNWLFVPRYGFQAAALATIASEAMLLIPFLWALRRGVPGLSLALAGAMLWRPALAGAAMLALALALYELHLPALALVLAPLAYFALWWRMNPLGAAERRRLLPLLPMRFR